MPPSSGGERLPLREAVALGLIQGPTELLPISSSAHTALIPWILRWRCAGLEPDRRRAFEVALHAGTAVALLAGWARLAERRAPAPLPVLLCAIAPPAAAGYLLEDTIDRRLSGPPAIAAGLGLGACLMVVAERLPRAERPLADAGALDGLLLGAAQALALVPGISRNGAALTAARARGFAAGDARALSWQAGAPVMMGAAALKAYRWTRRRRRTGIERQLAAGAASACLSTLLSVVLASAWRRRQAPRSSRSAPSTPGGLRVRGPAPSLAGHGSLVPYAGYRAVLAAAVLWRLRGSRGSRARRRQRSAGSPEPAACR